MKTCKIVCSILLGIVLFFACKQDSEPSIEVLQKNETVKSSAEDAHVTFRGERIIPFKAVFSTKKVPGAEGDCTEAPYLDFNLQEFVEGKATHMGKLDDVTISFCGDGPYYKNGSGEFVAANGDKLFIKIPSEGEVGHVFPIEDPFYEARFQDPFEFDGGTGRFAGAKGGGVTDSFVDLVDDEGNFIPAHQTDHTWTGELILP